MFSPAALKDVCDNLPKSNKYHNHAQAREHTEKLLTNPQTPIDLAMVWAGISGSVIATQELLDQGYRGHLPNQADFSNRNPLLDWKPYSLSPKEWKRVLACWDLLIANGADVNFNCLLGNDSGVPIHIHANQPAAIEYLMKKGANPLLKTGLGHTPLWGWLQGFQTLGNNSARAKAALKLIVDAGVDPHALIPSLYSGPEQTFMDYMYDFKSLRSLIPWAIEQGFDPNHTKQKKSAATRITDAYNRGNPSKEISAAYDAVFHISCEGQKQRIQDEIDDAPHSLPPAKRM